MGLIYKGSPGYQTGVNDFLATKGYTPNGEGGYTSTDPENSAKPEKVESELEAAGFVKNPGGVTIDGKEYTFLQGFANNDPDPVKAMQIEKNYLTSKGVSVIDDPTYGPIALDDEKFSAAHPEQNNDSIFDFGPLALAAFMVFGPMGGAEALFGGAAGASTLAGEGAGLIAGTNAAESMGTLALDAAGTGNVAYSAAATTAAMQSAAQVAAEWVQDSAAFPGSDTFSNFPGDITTPGNEWLPQTVESPVAPGAPAPSTANIPSPIQDLANQIIGDGVKPPGFWDKVESWAQNNELLAQALVSGTTNIVGGLIRGIGANMTMKEKIELEKKAKESLAQFLTAQSSANMLKNPQIVKPGVKAPLQRLIGGSVYGSTGLINAGGM